MCSVLCVKHMYHVYVWIVYGVHVACVEYVCVECVYTQCVRCACGLSGVYVGSGLADVVPLCDIAAPPQCSVSSAFCGDVDSVFSCCVRLLV